MQIGRGRPWGTARTVYEEIGGDETVRCVADMFYDVVEKESPTIQAMLPANTRVSRQKLYEFLSGWMGGPHLYWERPPGSPHAPRAFPHRRDRRRGMGGLHEDSPQPLRRPRTGPHLAGR